MALKLIIFDLDGTLVDSRVDIMNAVNYAISPYHMEPMNLEETTTLVGEGVTRLFARLLEKRKVNLDVPGLVARILNGTGHVNVGQGAVMTAQNIGAALSPALGGWIAQKSGYPITFFTLGAFALVSIGLWIGFSAQLKLACDQKN